MSIFDTFDRIYIVNLPERADRRKEMNVELARVGLRVDGHRIRYFKAIRPADAGRFPSVGSRGCFLSHLAILNEAMADGLRSVLIMEDDLSIDARCARLHPEMVRRLGSDNWQFAYVGHVASSPDSAHPSWINCHEPLATTHFYGLHRSVMAPLHAHLEACLAREPGHPLGSPMHVDGAYSLFRAQHTDLTTLIAAPSLGHQRSSRSDIFPNKWYDRLAVTRLLAGLARRIKNALHRHHPLPQSTVQAQARTIASRQPV